VGIEREFPRAVLVSALALALDVALLYALASGLHIHYQIAAAAGFIAGLSLNYALSVRFVFTHRRVTSRTQEFAFFAAIGAGGLALNAALLAGMVELLRQHYLIGKIVAAGGTFLFNFGARRWLLFTPRQEPRYD